MGFNGKCATACLSVLLGMLLTLALLMPGAFAACSYTGNAGLNFYCQICIPPSCSSSTILYTDVTPCPYCDGDYISSDGALCTYTLNVACGNDAQCDFTSDPSCCNMQGNYDWRSFLGLSETNIIAQCPTCSGTAYTVDWDTATYCTSTCAGLGGSRPVAWDIGGQYTEPSCCGDDVDEFAITCADDDGVFCLGLPLASQRDGCCDDASDCMYDNTCYNMGDEIGGRNCSTSNTWRDDVGPIVTVTGAPAGWVNTPQLAGITCNDLASSCDGSSYRLYTSAIYPGPCENIDYSFYPSLPPLAISSHVWVCGAALDVIGNPGYSLAPAPIEFLIDMDSPTTTINSPPSGDWRSSNFNVDITDADTGGSGVDAAECEYRVWDVGLATYVLDWTSRTCSASDAMVPVGGGGCQTEGLNQCRIEARAKDVAGNQGSTATRFFSIDLGEPSCSFNSITELTFTQYQYVSGTTVWYNTDSGGSFRVNVDASDPESGVDRVDFPATVSGGGSDPASPYYWDYSWDVTDSYDATATATCYDNLGGSATTDFNVDLDDTDPSGGSIDYPDGFWNLSDVSVDFGTVSDSESGINASSAKLYRRERTLSGGLCVGAGWTAWGAPIATGAAAAPPNYMDSTTESGKCYQYKYDIFDNVFNPGSYQQPGYELKVDRSPPAGPATSDNANSPSGVYDDDGILTFTYTPPGDPESGLDECYMQIDDAADFATPVFEGWVGSSGSYTWNFGVNGNSYYARVRCRDNAGNLGGYGAASNGIMVDTAGPVISFVHDIRDFSDTDDVDSVINDFQVGAYWEASDGESSIVSMRYDLFEEMGAGIRMITSSSSGIASLGSGYVIMLNFSDGSLPELLVSGKNYKFNITVIDTVGHVTNMTSDGFTQSVCEGQPCGRQCSVSGELGVCDSHDKCYIGGLCDLTCSPPVGPRACYDNNNNPIDCSEFSINPLLYCGRFGATKCGDTSLCMDSIITGSCVNPATGSGLDTNIAGGWATYTPPTTSQYYGPNRPMTMNVTGIVTGAAGFRPLLEFTFQSPAGNFYVDRWGVNNADILFSSFPAGSDGVWDLTGCSLKTDYAQNTGWDIDVDNTVYSPYWVDTTAPNVVITGPPDGSDVGVKFDLTWNGDDPVVNGVSSGLNDYHLQYVDKSNYLLSGVWDFDVPGITDSYYEVDLSTQPPGAEFCFRIKARDNIDNEAPWSCEPGPPATADFSGCHCVTLNKDPPPSVSIRTSPLYTSAVPASFNVNWSSAGTATKCYEVWFNLTNQTGDTVVDWTRWDAINDMFNVPVWDGGTTYYTVDCTSIADGAVFMPISILGVDVEDRSYNFRVRAVAAGIGYTAISGWAFSENGSIVDRTSPYVVSTAKREIDGSSIPEGDYIMTGEEVTIEVQGDPPPQTDFSGVNETWLEYNMTWATGSSGNVYKCPGTADNCEVTIGPWFEDYNISYQGHARDRAGNPGWSTENSFLVKAKMALLITAREIYLTLGSFDYITLDVANRQNLNEEISIRILDDYMWSNFVEVEDGTLSLDKRTLNISLSPMETKRVVIRVYTADIGSWNMTIYANSTLPGHEDINGMKRVRIRTVFPVEFPGLSWPAVMLLFITAALAYLRFGAEKG